MKEQMCRVADCLWTERDRFCTVLKKADVPLDEKWPLLLLHLRGIRENTLLSEVQQGKMQELLLGILDNKDFSDQHYAEIQEQIQAIVIAPYEYKLREVAREASELTQEVNKILGAHTHDVISASDKADSDLARGIEPASILSDLRGALKDVVAKMEKDTHILRDLSRKDSLTGLANRRSFDLFIDETVELWKKEKTPAALILFDIDHFKAFNDTYGHLVGDQVLQGLAKHVEKARDFLNTSGSDVLAARYGGEEFALVLRGKAVSRAIITAEDLRKTIEKASLLLRDASDIIIQSDLKVTVSLGVSYMWSGWTGAYKTNFIDCADKALYKAKSSGRNCTVEYTPEQKNMYRLEKR